MWLWYTICVCLDIPETVSMEATMYCVSYGPEDWLSTLLITPNLQNNPMEYIFFSTFQAIKLKLRIIKLYTQGISFIPKVCNY